MSAITPRWLPWALLPLGVVAHLPALANGFVLDDGSLLVRNPHLRTLEGLGQLLTHEFFAASAEPRDLPYYRPLSGLCYWLTHQLFGSSAALQHAFNLLLHGLVSVAFAQVLLHAGTRRMPALLAAALFAVHPATPEIVAYVGGRQDMMGWLAVLGAWWWCLRRTRQPVGLAGATFAATAVAALCREFFLATPLLLLAALVPAAENRRRSAAAVTLGGGLGLIFVFALRHLVAVQALQLDPPGAAKLVVTAAGVALRLLQVAFWPTDVATDVTVPALGLPLALALLATLGAATVLSLVWLFKRSAGTLRLAAFAWATFWATVVLHTPIAIKWGIVSDRYAYGVVLAAVCGAVAVLGAVKVDLPLRPALARALACALVAALLPLTWSRDADWRTEITLQLAMFRDRPQDPEAQFAEGMRRFYLEEYDAAYPLCLAYEKATVEPNRAGLCLGTISLLRKQPALAVRKLKPYAFARPGSTVARVRLFQAWFAAGDLEGVRQGLEYFGRYAGQSPDMVAARQEYERRRR